MMILGIDPGASTGVATFIDGQLTSLETFEPYQVDRVIRGRQPGRVIFEDSRLEKRAWNARTKGAYGAALATARSLGQVDAWCSLITAVCADLNIPAHGISPAVKGAKLDAPAFSRVTGWTERCNQHERDAAMVAWPFRRSATSRGGVRG
ncbi:hypothetical protein [Ottowia sp. VDI28]|uniref:hypothetical protein n=1 Tax=Ottowia sp. VDI28 TaxID=3133968 RepID=UPI003C2E3AF4